MQAVGKKQPSSSTTPVKAHQQAAPIAHAHWMSMYGSRPSGSHELFELEAMIAKRMELLAWIDLQLNSQKSGNLGDVLKKISDRLPRETAPSTPQKSGSSAITLGSDDGAATALRSKDALSEREIVSLSDGDDLMSHLLCRFAFCMSDKWRKWFIRVEEILLRAKYIALRDRGGPRMIANLLTQNGLPCEPVTEENAPPKLAQYIELLKAKSGSAQLSFTVSDFVSVPLGLATRLVRDRQVLMHKGFAILQYSQAHEVFLAVYRTQLARGLHDAFQLRNKNDSTGSDEDSNSSLMMMLDAFLSRFVAEPQDHLKEMTSGVVRHQDVAGLAQTHFPLCMRRVDVSMREHGHLKHHGRLMYGLFLKAIGLSMEDSMQLFSNVMTVKGGGSVEAFAKSSYGYNVRYNYGKEGKKTSYSSFSCATVVALPPMTDRIDCHGCPFRFRDEGALRQVLAKEQPNPYGADLPKVKAMPSAIEEIVQDAKDQHYTRACYKYFMATHPDAKRDSLFRSPFEYHVCSLESKLQREKELHTHLGEGRGEGSVGRAASEGGSAVKRSPAPFLREGSARQRTEE
jgi:DNA primase large subunit